MSTSGSRVQAGTFKPEKSLHKAGVPEWLSMRLRLKYSEAARVAVCV
ncbi:hypothetical protein BH20VER2_BH20VER2_11370 [soil metagenome]